MSEDACATKHSVVSPAKEHQTKALAVFRRDLPGSSGGHWPAHPTSACPAHPALSGSVISGKAEGGPAARAAQES
jgi:hypothetical protein